MWLRRIGGGLVALSVVIAGVQLASAQVDDRLWLSKATITTVDAGAETTAVTDAMVAVYPSLSFAKLKDYECVQSFNGVKVFSATRSRDRQELGDRITNWLSAHTQFDIVDRVVMQSSDSAFHCLTIILFYIEPI